MKQGKRLLAVVLALCLVLSLGVLPSMVSAAQGDVTSMDAPAPSVPIYKDAAYSFEERAADLVSRMTLAEKASQMNSSKTAAIPRLGVQSIAWWNEALHGAARVGYNSGNPATLTNTTSYPTSLALGSTWDPDLMYKEATQIGDEAREVVPGNNSDLGFYSPTINMARDPRWGRNDEAFSEDPFLTTKIASQFINGMEGKDTNGNLLNDKGFLKTVTTLKHYAANNSEVNRRTGSSNMDDRTLREYYTSAFKGVINAADPASVMTTYNFVNNAPSANVYMMDHLLRQTFGFNGFITGDCDSIKSITDIGWTPPGWNRKVNTTEREAFAMSAGEDLQCNSGYSDTTNYGNTAPTAINSKITTETGLFTENDVDVSLNRLFTARMKLGEFDANDNVSWAKEAKNRLTSYGITGDWSNTEAGNTAKTETKERLDLAAEIAAKSIVLLKNDEVNDGKKLLPLKVPTSGAYKVAVIGYFANPSSIFLGGYSSSQGASGIAKSMTPFNGIKKAIQDINPDASVTFYNGFTSGTTAATLTSIKAADVDAAAAADVVIVYAGTDGGTAKEDLDRSTLALPGVQTALITQVAAKNPNTVVIMETVGSVNVTAFEKNVPAMLWSSYNGQRKGEGVANLLLGKVAPSGRLPFTWYKSEADLPDIKDYTIRPNTTNVGRTYMYYTGNEPSYPFGYGMTYADFDYSNLQISKTELDANDTFTVSVDVSNIGQEGGDEVVQLYIGTPDAAAEQARPIKRLVGFQKIEALTPGGTDTVTFSVKVPDLAFFDQTLNRYVIDKGRYSVQVGRSSQDIRQESTVKVTGTLKPEVKVITVKATQEGDLAQDIPSRLIFQKGKKVIPNVTVAMNDETLYGYIVKNGSKELPKGMSISYTSNRPSVVSVAEDGAISTMKGGVATITATVTYNGVSKSEDFVVYVQSAGYLDNLTVDGKAMADFDYKQYAYTYTVPAGVNTIPVISTDKNDPDMTFTVKQATSIPGSATIVTTEGSESQTYTVGFVHPPTSADFTSGSIPSSWTIMNQDSSKYKFVPAGLQISTQVGDFSDNSFKNLFLTQAGGDWVAQTNIKLSASPTTATQQAGLIIYGDNNNYLKLDYERSGTSNVFRFYNTVNGSTTQVGTVTSANQTNLYFRISKIGSVYTAFYSTNGTTFTQIGTAVKSTTISIPMVGLFASNGSPSSAGSIDAIFSSLNFFDVGDLNPTASSITVDGSALVGFSPSETNYSMVVPRSQTSIPVVAATVTNASLNVTVTQATSLPGVATITISSNVGSITYNLTIGYAPTSSSFMEGVIDSNWKIINPDAANYSVVEGKGLRLPTQNGDFYGTGTSYKNLFVRPAAGDWDVISKVYFPEVPNVNYQQAAMVAWQDEQNYVKIDVEYGGNIRAQFSSEKNNTNTSSGSDVLNPQPSGSMTVYLRMTKTGNIYTGSYSVDNVHYISVGSPVTANLTNTYIGIDANKNTTTGTIMDAYFQYVQVQGLSIASIIPVNVSTAAGTAPILPSEVTVINSDLSNSTLSVTWDTILPEQYANAGTFIVNGHVAGTDILAKANVNVVHAVPLAVTVSGVENAVVIDTKGGSLQMIATITPDNAEDKSVTWSVSNTDGSSAPIATISAAGVLNANKNGTVTVRAVTTNNVVGEATITISNQDGLTLSGSFNDVLVNQVFDVQLGLSNMTGSVYAQDITIKYDPEMVEFLSAESVKEGLTIIDKAEETGTVRLILASLGEDYAVSNDDVLLKLQFKSRSISNSATSPITLSKAILADGLGDKHEVTNLPLFNVNITVVDKTTLNDLILHANTVYQAAVEGTKQGQYHAGSKAILLAAINSAQTIADLPTATQVELNQAIRSLEAALVIFDEALIVSIPGDLNADGLIDIADLGIVAYAYGKTSSSPNWLMWKVADINNDGKVDIVDLAFVAKLIIN